jgi:hypothetical protein
MLSQCLARHDDAMMKPACCRAGIPKLPPPRRCEAAVFHCHVQVRLQNALSAAISGCAKRTEELVACKSEVASLRSELQSTKASHQKHLQQIGSLRASLQAASATLQAAGLEAPEPCRESGFSLMLLREKEQLILRLDHEVQRLDSQLRQAKQEAARMRAQMRQESMQAALREEQLLNELQCLEADAEDQVSHCGLLQACCDQISSNWDDWTVHIIRTTITNATSKEHSAGVQAMASQDEVAALQAKLFEALKVAKDFKDQLLRDTEQVILS